MFNRMSKKIRQMERISNDLDRKCMPLQDKLTDDIVNNTYESLRVDNK